jgi:hypothetical protein
MNHLELSTLTAVARVQTARWSPRWKIGNMELRGRQVRLSHSANDIAVALNRNPLTGGIEDWGPDVQMWRRTGRIVPGLLRA